MKLLVPFGITEIPAAYPQLDNLKSVEPLKLTPRSRPGALKGDPGVTLILAGDLHLTNGRLERLPLLAYSVLPVD